MSLFESIKIQVLVRARRLSKERVVLTRNRSPDVPDPHFFMLSKGMKTRKHLSRQAGDVSSWLC